MFRNTIAVGPFFPWTTSFSGSYDSEAICLTWDVPRNAGLWWTLSCVVGDTRRRAVVSLARDILKRAQWRSVACYATLSRQLRIVRRRSPVEMYQTKSGGCRSLAHVSAGAAPSDHTCRHVFSCRRRRTTKARVTPHFIVGQATFQLSGILLLSSHLQRQLLRIQAHDDRHASTREQRLCPPDRRWGR
jgi:hypothetical protein